MSPRHPPHALTDLLGEVADASATLVRDEIRLVRAELAESVDRARTGAARCAVGAALLHTGALALVGGAIAGLSLLLPAWQAALIVGGVVLLAGLGFVLSGRRQIDRVGPRRAMREASATLDMIQEQIR